MNIASLLGSVPESDRPALIFTTSHPSIFSFRQLDELSSRLAGGFLGSGLKTRSRVVVLAPISLNLYAGLIALFKMGATPVFLDPQSGFGQLEKTISSIRPDGLICGQKINWLRWFLPDLRRIPRVFPTDGNSRFSLNRLTVSFSPHSEISEVDLESPALITFTGGSTDPLGSRGVIRTHGFLAAQHAALSRALPNDTSDIDMPAFPIATLHNLASGITSVIPDFPFRRPDAVRPERILEQIRQHEVTTASGPPAYWSVIVEHCLRLQRSLPLRRIVTGGAPVTPFFLEKLERVAPHAEILNVYGSTEAEPVAVIKSCDAMDEMKKPVAPRAGIPLGRAVPEVRIRILSADGIELETGQVGEIWVGGNHVARKYFSNPAAESKNKRFDSDGVLWHCMGDLGYKDETGLLWLAGRVNTIVVRGEKNLYPVFVETMAEALPFVRRAALIGMPDSKLGERSVLIVEFAENSPKPKDWVNQLRALCGEHGWALDEIRAARRLPVDARHNSRLDYKRLKTKRLG